MLLHQQWCEGGLLGRLLLVDWTSGFNKDHTEISNYEYLYAAQESDSESKHPGNKGVSGDVRNL